jgi:dTDP-glucose 4,6-dehydratase
MKNILVTGGAGFIGANFIRYALKADQKVNIINLDALTYAGNPDNLAGLNFPERYTFVQGDICDQELVSKLFELHEIDTVVHFAAESHVDRSIHGPEAFVETNIKGTFVLLETARKFWLGEEPRSDVRFHHISTDEVFGSLMPDDPAFHEKTPYDPRSPYSASKASSDHLVRAYFHTYGLPITISNSSNNYGPYQFPEKLFPVIILNCLKGKPIPVYGDGKQVRDWLYVEDHCSAIWEILVNGREGETYNIGGNCERNNLEVIEAICDFMDIKLPDSPHKPHRNLISFVKDRPGHDRRYAMDIEKISNELKWQPKESFESGVEKTVDWYLSHLDWIDRIYSREDFKVWVDKNYSNRE